VKKNKRSRRKRPCGARLCDCRSRAKKREN